MKTVRCSGCTAKLRKGDKYLLPHITFEKYIPHTVIRKYVCDNCKEEKSLRLRLGYSVVEQVKEGTKQIEKTEIK